MLTPTTEPRHQGRAGALLQTGEPYGVGLSTLVGTRLVPALGPHGWRYCLIGSSVTAMLTFVVRRFVPESDLWLAGGARGFGQEIARLFAGNLAARFR